MAFTQMIQTFRTDLNRKADQLVAQFNAVFNVADNHVIQDVAYSRLQSTARAGDLHLRVAYGVSTVTGMRYLARLYVTSGVQTAQDAFNADFEAGFAAVPLFILDVSDHENVKNSRDQILVIFAITNRGVAIGNGLIGHQQAVFIAEPVGDILPGATGNCAMYDANGEQVATGIPVVNMSTINPIVAGERILAVYDICTGGYMTLPSCCGAAPLATTTSSSTPPPIPCVTREVPIIAPKGPELNAWA